MTLLKPRYHSQYHTATSHFFNGTIRVKNIDDPVRGSSAFLSQILLVVNQAVASNLHDDVILAGCEQESQRERERERESTFVILFSTLRTSSLSASRSSGLCSAS